MSARLKDACVCDSLSYQPRCFVPDEDMLYVPRNVMLSDQAVFACPALLVQPLAAHVTKGIIVRTVSR